MEVNNDRHGELGDNRKRTRKSVDGGDVRTSQARNKVEEMAGS